MTPVFINLTRVSIFIYFFWHSHNTWKNIGGYDKVIIGYKVYDLFKVDVKVYDDFFEEDVVLDAVQI